MQKSQHSQHSQKSPHSQQSPQSQPWQNLHRHVMVVDDAPDIQSLLSELLTGDGYEVTCANNGTEALEKLRTCNSQPGVILLDLMMPEMDGYQFRKVQEEDPQIAGIHIVVMTAGEDVQSKMMRLGAHGFLKKPFPNADTVLATVGRHFPPI